MYSCSLLVFALITCDGGGSGGNEDDDGDFVDSTTTFGGSHFSGVCFVVVSLSLLSLDLISTLLLFGLLTEFVFVVEPPPLIVAAGSLRLYRNLIIIIQLFDRKEVFISDHRFRCRLNFGSFFGGRAVSAFLRSIYTHDVYINVYVITTRQCANGLFNILEHRTRLLPLLFFFVASRSFKSLSYLTH